MKILDYSKIFFWYVNNLHFFPNFLFLVLSKVKKALFSEHLKKFQSEDLKYIKHEKFYKINQLKKKKFKVLKIYKKIIIKNKNIIKNYGGAADLDLLFTICSKNKSKNFSILETGVALGWSSLTFLFFLKKGNRNLTSVDMPYWNKSNFDYVGSIVPNNLKTKWILIREPDIVALKKISLTKKKFNLVHYDSDKSYYGRKKSYETLWFLIKKNGIIISDDISDNYAFINFVKQKKLIKNKSYFILKYKNKFIGIAIKK